MLRGSTFEQLAVSIVISYHNIGLDLKRQNRLKVGTDKPKLKVKIQSVSDDYVWKRLLEKPRFELVAKGVMQCRNRKNCALSAFWTVK